MPFCWRLNLLRHRNHRHRSSTDIRRQHRRQLDRRLRRSISLRSNLCRTHCSASTSDRPINGRFRLLNLSIIQQSRLLDWKSLLIDNQMLLRYLKNYIYLCLIVYDLIVILGWVWKFWIGNWFRVKFCFIYKVYSINHTRRRTVANLPDGMVRGVWPLPR